MRVPVLAGKRRHLLNTRKKKTPSKEGGTVRTGFVLPHMGPAASPQAIVHVAQQAEALGYDSV
jgi:hypothetical protein